MHTFNWSVTNACDVVAYYYYLYKGGRTLKIKMGANGYYKYLEMNILMPYEILEFLCSSAIKRRDGEREWL